MGRGRRRGGFGGFGRGGVGGKGGKGGAHLSVSFAIFVKVFNIVIFDSL